MIHLPCCWEASGAEPDVLVGIGMLCVVIKGCYRSAEISPQGVHYESEVIRTAEKPLMMVEASMGGLASFGRGQKNTAAQLC
jgi:hypothetical protein